MEYAVCRSAFKAEAMIIRGTARDHDRRVAELLRLFERIADQRAAEAAILIFRQDADGPEQQKQPRAARFIRERPLGVGDMRDELPLVLQHAVELRHVLRRLPQFMQNQLLAAAGAVYVPKGFARQIFRFGKFRIPGLSDQHSALPCVLYP